MLLSTVWCQGKKKAASGCTEAVQSFSDVWAMVCVTALWVCVPGLLKMSAFSVICFGIIKFSIPADSHADQRLYESRWRYSPGLSRANQTTSSGAKSQSCGHSQFRLNQPPQVPQQGRGGPGLADQGPAGGRQCPTGHQGDVLLKEEVCCSLTPWASQVSSKQPHCFISSV